MIPVKRPDPDDPEWIAWRAEARDAVQSLQREYTPGAEFKVKEELYKRAMPFLLRLFNRKCAYCESVLSNAQPGDVEHYRPKGRIRELDGKLVRVKIDGKECEHPGYWWLCYEWTNLLPACADCNRRRRHGDDGAQAGKADLFPIAGKRALRPGDPLIEEEALLLDPTDEQFDPANHFEFQKDGKIAPKTKHAQTTCELLGLNLRETLVEQRAVSYTSATALFSQFISVSNSLALVGQPVSEEENRLRRLINEMWEGKSQYSAFARLALATAKTMLQRRNIQIEFPLPLD